MTMTDGIPSLFHPNVVETPSASRIAALERGRREKPPVIATLLPPTTQGVRLQLTALQIIDGLQDGFLGFGAANGVYIVSTVVDGMSGQPVTFHGQTYQRLHNGDMVPIGAAQGAPLTVYFRKPPLPDVLAFGLLVLRSDQELRDVGAAITQVESMDIFKKVVDGVSTSLAAVNPLYSVAFGAVNAALNLVGALLSKDADEQLCYYQANYTNLFDNLGVGRYPGDAPTMSWGKVRLGYEIDAA